MLNVRWREEEYEPRLRSYPLESREIILPREFEELSYQEIASLLGCPRGTVM
jgi:RNA polymerase sigma-70 factor (ECF subfamily)